MLLPHGEPRFQHLGQSWPGSHDFNLQNDKGCRIHGIPLLLVGAKVTLSWTLRWIGRNLDRNPFPSSIEKRPACEMSKEDFNLPLAVSCVDIIPFGTHQGFWESCLLSTIQPYSNDTGLWFSHSGRSNFYCTMWYSWICSTKNWPTMNWRSCIQCVAECRNDGWGRRSHTKNSKRSRGWRHTN